MKEETVKHRDGTVRENQHDKDARAKHRAGTVREDQHEKDAGSAKARDRRDDDYWIPASAWIRRVILRESVEKVKGARCTEVIQERERSVTQSAKRDLRSVLRLEGGGGAKKNQRQRSRSAVSLRERGQ